WRRSTATFSAAWRSMRRATPGTRVPMLESTAAMSWFTREQGGAEFDLSWQKAGAFSLCKRRRLADCRDRHGAARAARVQGRRLSAASPAAPAFRADCIRRAERFQRTALVRDRLEGCIPAFRRPGARAL